MIDLYFPAMGETIPTEHAYALYGALSRIVPAMHEKEFKLRIGPINGAYVGQGKLQIDPPRSMLRLRTPAESIPQLLTLAGNLLELDGDKIRVGVPRVQAIVPAATLYARFVTIKASDRTDKSAKARYTDPTEFLAAVHRDLAHRNIAAEPSIPLVQSGPHAGKPRRHLLRIKDKIIVGFPLLIEAISAEDSIRLQTEGLGGRPKLGGGFFVPIIRKMP